MAKAQPLYEQLTQDYAYRRATFTGCMDAAIAAYQAMLEAERALIDATTFTTQVDVVDIQEGPQ